MWSFLDGVFGTSGSAYLNAAFALGIVLVLIVLGLWALKFVFRTSTNVVRGRNRRLAVIDSLPIDQKRQLLLIRRDNVDHLILMGGSQDIVVETGIPVEAPPARAQMRRPMPPGAQRAAGGPRQQPNAAPQPQPPAQPQVQVQAPPPDGNQGYEEPVPAPPSPLERLRDLGRGAQAPRQGASLRHTGLMRQDGRIEPAVIHGNPAANGQTHPDSAKNGQFNGRVAAAMGDPDGQAPGDEDYRPYRNDLRSGEDR